MTLNHLVGKIRFFMAEAIVARKICDPNLLKYPSKIRDLRLIKTSREKFVISVRTHADCPALGIDTKGDTIPRTNTTNPSQDRAFIDTSIHAVPSIVTITLPGAS